MIRSIKLTYYRDDPAGNWPFSINWDLMDSNLNDLLEAGIQLYYTPDLSAIWADPSWSATRPHTYDSIMTMDHHYVFPTDEIYASAKDLAYSYVPVWKNLFTPAELTEYQTANQLRVEYTEIENPDLSSYVIRDF